MAERLHARHLVSQLVFVALALALTYGRLMPLSTEPVRWPGPDVLLALTLCWSLRRPDAVPILLVAAVFFLSDLLYQRPPGLMAALVVAGSEALRGRSRAVRSGTLLSEWLSAGMAIVAITLANRMIQILIFVAPPPLAIDMLVMTMTIVIYPLVALLSHVVFSIRRPALGEVDDRGRRL